MSLALIVFGLVPMGRGLWLICRAHDDDLNIELPPLSNNDNNWPSPAPAPC